MGGKKLRLQLEKSYLNTTFMFIEPPMRLFITCKYFAAHCCSSNRGEPAHIHVKRDRQIAKFWLDPISVEKNRGFQEYELNQIARLVEENQTVLLDAWRDYFDT